MNLRIHPMQSPTLPAEEHCGNCPDVAECAEQRKCRRFHAAPRFRWMPGVLNVAGICVLFALAPFIDLVMHGGAAISDQVKRDTSTPRWAWALYAVIVALAIAFSMAYPMGWAR